MTPVRFPFDEKKALEALVFVAKEWPGVSAFFASKVMFLADKHHLNQFGRPVLGDRYIAMDNGPVPSTIYDWFKGNLERMGDPEAIVGAIDFAQKGSHAVASAKRDPDLSVLSKTDIGALTDAVAFCRKHSFSELSRYTHDDKAWQEAALNAEMDPMLMIEGEGADRDRLVEAAEEYAAYGVA